MVNTSETCAATRLAQCRSLGISMNDVSQKFMRSPEAAPDLSEADFMARKEVIGQVSRWCHDNKTKPAMIYKNEWAPILYRYEVLRIFLASVYR